MVRKVGLGLGWLGLVGLRLGFEHKQKDCTTSRKTLHKVDRQGEMREPHR
jgi:hypothetical protein